METSLGRLQKQVDTLNEKLIKTQDSVDYYMKKAKNIQNRFNKYKKEVDERVEKNTLKRMNKIIADYEKEIEKRDKRIQKLEEKLSKLNV